MRYIYIIGVLFLSLFVFGQDGEKGYVIEEKLRIKTTPVKNQGASGTCWSYAATSFLETEILRSTGKSLNLSEMYTVYTTYLEKADQYVRMHGNMNFGQGGQLHDVLEMYKKYGAIPEKEFSGLQYGTDINRHGEMEAILKAILDAVISNKNKKITPVWKDAYASVLEVYLGKVPEKFEYDGREYSPNSFAEEVAVLDADAFIQITSWTHQPYYESMTIMVPDNWMHRSSFNVPLEQLVQIIDHALKNGYTVGWATDISEKGFSWKEGMAIVPSKEHKKMTANEKENLFKTPSEELTITPEIRQKAYDNYTTTDDHGLHIIGLAEDKHGKEYYIVKNSWDNKNKYLGYLYVSKTFVEYKTISIVLNRSGVPKNILNKLEFD